MKNHAAVVTIALTILCLLALLEFTPRGLASKVQRPLERAATKRENKSKKADKSKSRVRTSSQDLAKSTLVDLLQAEQAHYANGTVEDTDNEEGSDPDLPSKRFLRNRIDKGEYQRLRDEYFASLRGVDLSRPFDPTPRVRAIEMLTQQKRC